MDANIIVHDLPLLELFHRLCQAGLPLGVDEYQVLLRALQGGFGLPDRAALTRLCKTLWIKSIEEERLFDYHFERVMPLSTISESVSPQQQSVPDQPKTPTSSPLPGPDAKTTTILTPATTSELALNMDDEVQVAKAVSLATSKKDIYDYFIQTDEYFPITRRQMKQSWRYLRRLIREGPPIELDVEATVDRVGRQGMLLEPVLVPRRVNRAELLLLIDQGGSMVPFHIFSRRLAETAARGGRLGKAGVYYFHNCPIEHLYHDPARLEAKPIQNILDDLHYGRVGIVIFSDAGAARNNFRAERVKMTKRFLDRLTQRVRYVAWLNPMSRSRWFGTTADEIMHLVPMFDLSRRGLDDTISLLRGRHPPSIHFETRM